MRRNGTLLDNCMIVYGSGISDGDRHNHVLRSCWRDQVGYAIDPGRHLVYSVEHH